jgi:hypothetical protein
MSKESNAVHVGTSFGINSKTAWVKLSFEKVLLQLTPLEARTIAGNMIEAAGAAETENVLMRLLVKRCGLDLLSAARILGDMRKERDLLRLDEIKFPTEGGEK